MRKSLLRFSPLLIALNAFSINLPQPQATTNGDLSSQEIPKPLPIMWSNREVGRYLPSALSPTGMLPRKSPYQSNKVLRMQDAILLALRNNPDIQSADMQRVLDKFNFILAKRAFSPTFSTLDFGITARNGEKNQYSALSPHMNWSTLTGTRVTLGYNQPIGTGERGSGDMEITQPLLQGLHENQWKWQDEKQQEQENKIAYQDKVESVVSGVMAGYLSLVQAKMNALLQKNNFHNLQKQYQFAKWRLQAGQISKSDFRQQKSSFVSSEISYTKQKDLLSEQYYDFTQTLGLGLNAKLVLPSTLRKQLHARSFPSYSTAIKNMLKHNNQYILAKLDLLSQQRQVEVARDQLKWGLSVSVDHHFGNDDSPGNENNSGGSNDVAYAPSALNNSVFGGSKGDTSASVNLSIPIDNYDKKAGLVQQRITYELAKIKLQQTKRQMILNLKKDYDQAVSDKQQISLAKQNVYVKREVLADTELKYKYGQTTAFELGQVQQDLLSAEQDYVQSQVSYFLDIYKVNQDMGLGLSFWHISLRY